MIDLQVLGPIAIKSELEIGNRKWEVSHFRFPIILKVNFSLSFKA